jgi:hypothetical protein
MFDKYTLEQVRKDTAEYLDKSIYPKVEVLVTNYLEKTIEDKVRDVAKQFFKDRNEELAKTLIKIIELLAIDRLNKGE